MNCLSRGDTKKLALHRAVAARLRRDPDSRRIAHQRIAILRAKNPHGRPYYDRWEELLSGPLEHLLDMLTSTDEKSAALRQESPFGDLIDQRERARLYRAAAASFDQAI